VKFESYNQERFSASQLEREVTRRRTFAIISHPDAGKTTLTEKLLLYGGAIHLAGAVKKKGNQKHATSDWMEIEKQRGISVTTSVLAFEYQGYQINLLDTPGHKDFSEDTYRTLIAADSAVMLLDAAKGVEPQTKKLFEVCRMRGIPIFTFINKMDRFSREPLSLLDELENTLGIRSCPITWPIGMGDRFRGIFDKEANEVHFFEKDEHANALKKLAPTKVAGIDDPLIRDLIGAPGDGTDTKKALHQELKNELELLDIAGDPFNAERVLAGNLTPVFFGSAMNNFGVQHFLEHFISIAPIPAARKTSEGPIEPTDKLFSGFIFKIQANMDPSHRDRVAFMRVCSGKFRRGMDAIHGRLGKAVRLSKPIQFFAQERELIDEAWPGDIVGLLDTSGELRIGDTLSENRRVQYEGVPSFSPEHFAAVLIQDPLKRKQLKKGLDELSEEGVIQVFHRPGLGDKDPVLGAVGALQFEVLQHRLKNEYGADIKIERLPYIRVRWIEGENLNPEEFNGRSETRYIQDKDGHPVVLFTTEWILNWITNQRKDIRFSATAPLTKKL
jgi:peptide chain release factor 3